MKIEFAPYLHFSRAIASAVAIATVVVAATETHTQLLSSAINRNARARSLHIHQFPINRGNCTISMCIEFMRHNRASFHLGHRINRLSMEIRQHIQIEFCVCYNVIELEKMCLCWDKFFAKDVRFDNLSDSLSFSWSLVPFTEICH